jgi:prepilin-type N-terminal cleavage/methylation domain-containing protein
MRLNSIRRRAGFTLVELMVAAAVCVLIMAILSRAFVVSADTMRQLKATGDMADQLRAASAVLRRDLAANHFLPEDGRPNKGLKVSDQRLDRLSIVGTQVVGWTPPVGGFFRARSFAPTGAAGSNVVSEGTDNDGLLCYRIGADLVAATGQLLGHYLHFTSVLPGGRDGDFYTAAVGGNTFTSPAAELAYFLVPQQSIPGTGATTLYNLIRRQRLVALYDTDRQALVAAATQPDGPAVISVQGATVNTMADLTDPRRRLGGAAGLGAMPQTGFNDTLLSQASGGALNNRIGDDILLSNVLSFEVQLQWTSARQQNNNPTTPVTAFGTTNTDFPFDFIRAASPHNTTNGLQNTFDTWASANILTGADALTGPNAIPQRMRVKAVRIVLRVWDQKLKLSRQMTIVQDL